MQNSGDNVLSHIPVGKGEEALLCRFLAEHDFAENTRKAILTDVRRFAKWFACTNHEPFAVNRGR